MLEFLLDEIVDVGVDLVAVVGEGSRVDEPVEFSKGETRVDIGLASIEVVAKDEGGGGGRVGVELRRGVAVEEFSHGFKGHSEEVWLEIDYFCPAIRARW